MDEIVWLVPRLFFRLSAVSEDVCRDFDITPGKRSVMRDIAHGGPARISDMARARPVTRQYIQRLVAELESAGLVRLQPDPRDGRSKRVALTGAGRAMLDRLDARHGALGPTLLGEETVERLCITSEVLNGLAARLAMACDDKAPAGAEERS